MAASSSFRVHKLRLRDNGRRVSDCLELIGKASLLAFLKVSGARFGGPKVHTSMVAAAYSFLFVQLQSTSIPGSF